MDEGVRKLMRIASIKIMVFRRRRNETSDITLAGSEFHTFGAATEKAQIPVSFSPKECKEGYYFWDF